MCGIAGILSFSPDERVDADALRAMAGQLVHRGPDDEGFYVDDRGRCGLAFRRLAIIDLDTGNQPIASEDGSVQAVFNGEIYNFRELRAALAKRGHVFRTQGDAEVIVHAYEEYGTALAEHLHGMFAIAVWDATRGRLLLIRDRVGKKPLIFARFGDRVYFASEAKAILAIRSVPREIDPQSLHRYLVFQYVPAPYAIYRGFGKLLPGHQIVFDAADRGAQPRQQRYAPPLDQITDDSGRARSPDADIARLDELLAGAVRRRLVADVPLGAFLSGGVDSSVVVALMHRLGVSPLRTFSIGFADQRYDETRYARRVAELVGSVHHEHIVTPAAREILDALAYHYDEPFADSSAIPTYYVSRHARETVKVVLTGDGGDEGFAGYDRYRAMRLASRFDRVPAPLRRMMAGVAGGLPRGQAKSRRHRLMRFLAAMGLDGAARYLEWVCVFPPRMLRDGYRPAFVEQLAFDQPLAWLSGFYERADGGPAQRANRTDLYTYLPYDLLTKVDIASMACGLECRCPLLDPEVLAFGLSRSPHYPGEKTLLKRWAEQVLPPEIIQRPKMGFGVPVGEWFRGPLRGLIEDEVLAEGSLPSRIFCADWLRRLCASHLSGRENHAHRLWALLMLERWRRVWGESG